MFLKIRSNFRATQNKNLYLPIEIHSREFHSKLYFAQQACLRGWTVVLGPKYDVNTLVKYLPPGTYLGIGFHRSAARIASYLKKIGHTIVSQDEEGIVRLAPEFYAEYRVDLRIEQVSDHLLCWSDEHKSIVESIFPNSNKLTAVGNTRLDLLDQKCRNLFASDAMDIKSTHGNFILVNGNFGSANHSAGIDYWLNQLSLQGWFNSPEKEQYQMKRIAFQKRIFIEMMALVIDLVESGKSVIVRPHPSENIHVWTDLSKIFGEKIKIIRSGNVLSWLIAAEAVIHNGCTTAIEAKLLGKKVISYRPFRDPLVESQLPNHMSIEANSREEVIRILNSDLDKNLTLKDLGNFDFNIKQNLRDEDCASRILDLIEPDTKLLKGYLSRNIIQSVMLIFARLRTLVSRFVHRKSFEYEKSKCPDLKIDEVNQALTLMNFSGQKSGAPDVTQLTKHSVILKSRL